MTLYFSLYNREIVNILIYLNKYGKNFALDERAEDVLGEDILRN